MVSGSPLCPPTLAKPQWPELLLPPGQPHSTHPIPTVGRVSWMHLILKNERRSRNRGFPPSSAALPNKTSNQSQYPLVSVFHPCFIYPDIWHPPASKKHSSSFSNHPLKEDGAGHPKVRWLGGHLVGRLGQLVHSCIEPLLCGSPLL